MPALWSTPIRRLQMAIAFMFCLDAIGANAITYLTPLWLVATFVFVLCAISAFALVYGIAWLREGAVARPLEIGCVALSLVSGVGAIVRFPPEMDSSAIELSAIMGADVTQHAANVLKSATMALEGPDPSMRLSHARFAYRITGRAIQYRDASGQLTTFVPDADLRRDVDEAKKTESRVKAAINDFVANGLRREAVKVFAFLTLVTFACIAMYVASRLPREQL